MMDQKLRERLVLDEGLRLTAYKDSVGLWTIGIGHLLGDTPRMTMITRAEAFALFEADLVEAARLATKYAPLFDGSTVDNPTGQPERWRVLVNMAFNLGPKLAEFKKFLAAVNAEDWATAAVEMMDSKWAKQVGDRARRLRDVIRSGKETA